jgi:hypothetical protein
VLSGCAQKHLQGTPFEENIHVKITGCYSNLFYHEESEDILGWEFFIVYSGGDYHLLYQGSEGWPTVLLLLPITVNGNTIRFTIPRRNESRFDEFEGTITRDILSGSFSNGIQVVLERKESYWQ